MNRIVRGAVTAAMLYLTACAPLQKFPLMTGEPIAQEEVLSLRAASNERFSKIATLKGLYRMQVQHGSEVQSTRVAITYKNPASFVMEFYPTTSFYLLQRCVISEGNYLLLDMVNQQAQQGFATADTLAQLFGIAVDPRVLGRVLLGVLPDEMYIGIRSGTDANMKLGGEKRDVYAEFVSGMTLPSRMRFFNQDEIEDFEVNYQYKEYGDVSIPSTVKLTIPKVDVSVELTVQANKVNAPLQDDLFHTAVPDGFVLTDSL